LVDDGLNLALTAGVAIGLWRLHGSSLFLIGGLVTCAMLLTYNAVAYRELVRQGEGGEVLKVRWWFTGGADLKVILGSGKKRGGLGGVLLVIGRRDFFVLAWLLLALAGLAPAVLVYSFVIAAVNFSAAIGQLLWRRKRG